MMSKDSVAPVTVEEPILILIADDEEPIVEMLATFVADLGYTPLVAQNGQQALDLNASKLIMRQVPVSEENACQVQKDCRYDGAGQQGCG
jgi:CheY-like chemotaxis protein